MWFSFQINGTNIQKSTLEECYNIVRAATEQVTLKIVRPKPTQASDQTDNKPKPSKPSRPVEAAEVDITPKGRKGSFLFQFFRKFYFILILLGF